MGTLGWSLFTIVIVLALVILIIVLVTERKIKVEPSTRVAQYEQMRGRLKRGDKLTDEENLDFVQETLLRHGFTLDQDIFARLQARTMRQGQADPDVRIDHVEDAVAATERQVDLYAGTVFMAETRGETVDRQIREQMLYGGDTPVDFPDGKGGRVLVLNGEVHQLDWCEPPPKPEEAA